MTRRALDLASAGVGLVSPNPLVGCVIVSSAGKIVGEGTYLFEGMTHAEVIALKQAGEHAKGGTAYVSLEPHDHHGRTPPCTDALINAGIRRVVCPIEDPNPLVSGQGFKRLREAGIEVTAGILKEEGSILNEKFCVWHQKQRPFVHLKLATSLDGRISLKNSVSTALTSEAALIRVHELRHEHDAILVGGNTAFVDNPSLTDRSGKARRRKLARVILDNRLRLPLDSKLVETASESPTIVFTNSPNITKIDELFEKGVSVVESEAGARDLSAVLKHLKGLDIQSVLVEGGTEVAGAFFDSKLIDKFTFIMAPIVIGGPTAPLAIGGNGAQVLSEAMTLTGVDMIRHGSDFEVTGYPEFSRA